MKQNIQIQIKYSSTFFKRAAENLNFSQILRKVNSPRQTNISRQNPSFVDFAKCTQSQYIQNEMNNSQVHIPTNISVQIKSISMYDLGASMRKEAQQQEKSFGGSEQKSQSQSKDLQIIKEETNLDENEHVNISNQIQPNEIIGGNTTTEQTTKQKSISKRMLRKIDPSRIHSRRILTSSFTHLTQLFSSKSQIRHYYQSKQRQISKKAKEKDENQCLVCVNNPSDAVFMPCGHGGICYECSLDLWKRTGECYLCRNEINCVLQIDVANTFGEYLKIISETYLEAQGINEADGEENIDFDILQYNDDLYQNNFETEKFEQQQE